MSVRSVMARQLKAFRAKSGLSAKEVGDAIGKSEKTIYAWESERGQPDADVLIALCRLYSARISDFYSDSTLSDDGSAFVEVPLYGSIAAGIPIEMIPVDDLHPIPAPMHERYPRAFLLKVDGDSMDRILPNGCYALVDPRDEVEGDNAPYAVCVNGFDATIKRVKRLANGFQLVPDSTDPTYPVQTFNYNQPGTETITVLGKVVWYVIPFDWSF